MLANISGKKKAYLKAKILKLETNCSGCVVEFHTAAICGATASGLWLLSL